MRCLLVILFISIILQAEGQSFVTYKDTIHKFSINLPVGWKYGINKSYPNFILIAYRVPNSKVDSVRDNLNINTINTPNQTLEGSFADFMKSLPDAKNYNLISTGDTILNGKTFKWLIETHTNENNEVKMYNYDFLTVKNGITYILTMVTFLYNVDAIKPMFNQIAGSFVLLD